MDSKEDIDIGCWSPFSASVIDGSDRRGGAGGSFSSPEVLRVSGGDM